MKMFLSASARLSEANPGLLPVSAGEPGIYLPPRFANRLRMFEDARIGHQPEEDDHAGPRQADRTGTVELLIQPAAGSGVLSK